MFWLPYGWFPYYAEWIISFPRAPMGSVSAPSWQLACSGMIALLSEIIILVGGMIFSSSTTPKTRTKTKIAQPAEKVDQKKSSADTVDEKKEL